MRRPDKDYFKHDLLDIEDDRLGELIAEFGAEGYAVFYRIITLLHQRHGEPLETFAFKGIARTLKTTEAKVQEIVTYAQAECDHLLEFDGKTVYSNRVINDTRELEEERERIRKQKSEAGKKGNEIRWGKSIAEPSQCDSSATDSDSTAIALQSQDVADNRTASLSISKSISNNISKEKSILKDTKKEKSFTAEKINSFSLLLEDSTYYTPTADEFVFLQESYPSLDIEQEFRCMAVWCDKNPTKRKTSRGIGSFICNWLNRSKNDKQGTSAGSESDKFMKIDKEVW